MQKNQEMKHKSDNHEVTQERDLDSKKAVTYLRKIFNDARLAFWNCLNSNTCTAYKRSVSLPNIPNKYLQYNKTNFSKDAILKEYANDSKCIIDQEFVHDGCVRFLDAAKYHSQYQGFNQLLKQCEKRCTKIMKILTKTYEKEMKSLIQKVKFHSEHESILKQKYAVVQNTKQILDKKFEDTMSDYEKIAANQQDTINNLQRQLTLYHKQNMSLMTEIKNINEENISENILNDVKNKININRDKSQNDKNQKLFKMHKIKKDITNDGHQKLYSQENFISNDLEMSLLQIALKKISQLESQNYKDGKTLDDNLSCQCTGRIAVDFKKPTKMKILKDANIISSLEQRDLGFDSSESDSNILKEEKHDMKNFELGGCKNDSQFDTEWDDYDIIDCLHEGNNNLKPALQKNFPLSQSIPIHLNKIESLSNNHKSILPDREKPNIKHSPIKRPQSALNNRHKPNEVRQKRSLSASISRFQPIEFLRPTRKSESYMQSTYELFTEYEVKELKNNGMSVFSSKNDLSEHPAMNSTSILNISTESTGSNDSSHSTTKSSRSNSNFKILRSRRNAVVLSLPERVTKKLREHSENKTSPFIKSTNKIFKRLSSSSLADYSDYT